MSPGHGLPLCGPDLMALKTTTTTPDRLASVAEIIGIDSHELQDAFVCEDWNAELSTGLLRLGPETAFLHGAAGAPCGIMDLIRFYDPADLSRVLQTLEEAAAVSTEFTFATTIRQAPGLHRPVFCSGRSETTDSAGGVIHGTFAVARLCVELRTGTETLN